MIDELAVEQRLHRGPRCAFPSAVGWNRGPRCAFPSAVGWNRGPRCALSGAVEWNRGPRLALSGAVEWNRGPRLALSGAVEWNRSSRRALFRAVEWEIVGRDDSGDRHAKRGGALRVIGSNQGRGREIVNDGELSMADTSFDAVQLYQKMRDARIGRVLVGSLHQAIGDVLPARLEFYETWLKPEELRKGSIGQASFSAVLSFLRREGGVDYQDITTRAGQYAADWSFDMLGRGRRLWLGMLPFHKRAKAGLKLTRALVRDTHADCRATTSYEDGTASIEIIESPFCDVRESSASPLCWFFAAATNGLFVRLNLESDAQLVSCRAARGGTTCRIQLTIHKRTGSITRI